MFTFTQMDRNQFETGYSVAYAFLQISISFLC